jgi:hypothetical protein
MQRSSALVGWCLVAACCGCSGKGNAPLSAPIVTESKTSAEPAESGQPVTQVAADETAPNIARDLARAKELWWADDHNYVEILNRLESGLPTLKLRVSDAVPAWEKVTLNRFGVGFDAIRIEFPRDADLVFVFSDPLPTVWYEFTSQQVPHFRLNMTGISRNNVDVPGIGLPQYNSLAFQHQPISTTRLSGDFFLAFGFENYDQPVDIYLKMKCFEPQHLPDPATNFAKAQDFAPLLGLEWPLQFTKDATARDRARDVLEMSGIKGALDMLEKEVSKTSPRRDKLYYAKLAQEHGIQLYKNRAPRTESTPYILKSAALLREALEESNELTPEEMQLVPNAFYNEACCFAISGERDKAMQSLKQAVESGFRDVAQIRGDDDLESLRQLPEFQQLVEKLETE